MSIRVVLIDDHPLFRKGLAQLVARGTGFELVGETGDALKGIALAQRLDPDIVLVDLHMKPVNGIETIKGLKAVGIRAKCIVLTVSDDQRDVVAALRAGADGYLLKDLQLKELYRQLRQAASGSTVMAAGVAEVLANAVSTPLTAKPEDLTDREREILASVAEGLSNKEIARALNISDATVKVHITHLLRKLNMKSRLEAAVWALNDAGFRQGARPKSREPEPQRVPQAKADGKP